MRAVWVERQVREGLASRGCLSKEPKFLLESARRTLGLPGAPRRGGSTARGEGQVREWLGAVVETDSGGGGTDSSRSVVLP